MKTMGKSSRHLAASLMVMALVLIGCQDEILFHSNRPIEEGIPTRVSLGYVSQESIILTRTEQTSEYENRIENIYLFVFNSAGQRQPLLQNMEGDPRASNLFTFNDGLNPEGDNLSNGKGTLDFVCSSLQGASIVAIANITTNSTGTAYNVTSAQLDEINDLNTLKQFVMTMNSQSVYRGALFMMTGYAEDNESGSTSIDIVGSEQGEELNYTIQLKRTDAKVKFIVKTDPPSEKNWSNFSFLPKEWTVKRVPLQSYILEAETGDYESDDAIYFNTSATPFEEITPNATDANLYDGGSFVFYMPENKKDPKSKIVSTGDANADYARREAWNGEDDEGDKKFTNANANSTYVEMTGTLSYEDNDGQQVSADVRFTIHLGYLTSYKDEDGNTIHITTPNPNDYNTERNGYYTYNVKVRGIEDIIVEVTNSNDRRPGYEGDVVYSSDQIFEFDSHYDRRLITLNKSDIKDEMKWSINTPFSRGIHEMGTPIPQEMLDYRWIKFAVNADYGVAADSYVKYPGDQNYNDPYPMNESNNDLPSPYYQALGYENARLRDIDQLIKYLQEEAAKTSSSIFDAQGNVAITVFVDENLYFNHPLTNKPGEENRSLWKLTADKEDRQMHIISGGSKYSDDGNSSIVHSKFSFKQRTIRTIFNVDKEDLTTAWGLESTMETGRLGTGDVSQGTDTRNGRANCLKWLERKKWTDIIDTSKDPTSEEALKSTYRNAAYACMLRNRDLDGDNIIDPNEVRWYLASIDQLTDIYLGEYALDEQSRLYPSNAADREGKVRWHYTSSSANGSAAWILWAEEGASRGGSGGSIDDAGKTNTLFSYRCARNLGLPLDKPNDLPADLVAVTEEADGNYLIDVTNMSVKARRTNFEINRLPAHDERDADNRPYAKFRVHKDCYAYPLEAINGEHTTVWDRTTEDDADFKWINKQNWLYYQTVDPSPEGYRIPNHRELLIMSSRLTSEQWPEYSVTATYWERDWLGNEEQKGKTYSNLKPDRYVCQTAFSLNGTYPYDPEEGESEAYREGFLWEPISGVFFLQNHRDETGWIRPVQDVQ